MENGLLHITSGNASAGMALAGCSLAFTGICLPSGVGRAAPNKSVSIAPIHPPYVNLSNGGIALVMSAIPDIDDNARESRSRKR